MFTPAKLAVLLTAALSVAAMPSHLSRNCHQHREIAARVAQPEAAPITQIEARDEPVSAKRLVRKRGDTNRCKQPNNGGAPPSPSSTPSEDPKPTTTSSEEPAATPQVDLKPTSTPSQGQSDTPKDDPKPTTPTPTPTPASTPASTPNTGGGSTQTGQGTFYDIGLGACGLTSSEPQMVAAVSHQFFDQFTPDGNPNHNTLCGKKLQVTYQGKTFSDIVLVDRCGGCAGATDLDFSHAAFDRFASEGVGRLDGVTWSVLG